MIVERVQHDDIINQNNTRNDNNNNNKLDRNGFDKEFISLALFNPSRSLRNCGQTWNVE